MNRDCDFSGRPPLPILAVDEPIYRRLPCFLIATVDKFAALPWTGRGRRASSAAWTAHDAHGFYGPCDPGTGAPLAGGQLPPPDLIIQDELHLISGPLGTMAGLYETAIDALCTREVDGRDGAARRSWPRTATVRRADRQIRALFDRRAVDVFPPPGPDRRDSFFAARRAARREPPRLYLGVAAQGRSLKVVLLRTYLALLGAAQKAWAAAGGKRHVAEPGRPVHDAVGYFNSLRELGGSRRIVEDEVTHAAAPTTGGGGGWRGRAGCSPTGTIAYEVVELTSRVGDEQGGRGQAPAGAAVPRERSAWTSRWPRT